MDLKGRLKFAWNIFRNPSLIHDWRDTGPGRASRPDRARFKMITSKSLVSSIFTRIALDVSTIGIRHCQLDEQGRYNKDVESGLNECLTLEANIDQTSRAFMQDVVMSLFDEGVVAIVPIATDVNPITNEIYDIGAWRTAKVMQWYPRHVKVSIYNDVKGEREEYLLPKTNVAIIENPLYAIVNEPNSTMQRLQRKLALVDSTDEQSASGKLDLIIQLPYTLKTENRREQAERRRKDIEMQLTEGKLGIAYTDGTEKVIQLNRPVENNLMKQIEFLTNQLYAQLGMDQTILDGTANEQTMLNYYSRTVEPIVSAIVDELKRKFIPRDKRKSGETILAFRDPFKLVPVNNIAEIADKFTRNCILSSNEIRQIIGFRPSADPKADELINSNLNHDETEPTQIEGDKEDV